MTTKLLIAGDDHLYLRRLMPVLKARGAILTTAANAGAAENALQKATFDLLLLDLQMPGLPHGPGADPLGWLRSLRRADLTTPAGLLVPFWEDPRNLHQPHLRIAFAAHKTAEPSEVASRIATATGTAAPRRLPLLKTA